MTEPGIDPSPLAASSQAVEITTYKWCSEEALFSWAQNPHEGFIHLKGNIALTFSCIHFFSHNLLQQRVRKKMKLKWKLKTRIAKKPKNQMS